MIRPRVLIADDHTLLLEAFRSLLADDCDVVRAVSAGRAPVEAAITLTPDVAVVDIGLPLLNGIDATPAIRQACPEPASSCRLRMKTNLAVEAFRRARGYRWCARPRRAADAREVVPVGVTPLMTEGVDDDDAARGEQRRSCHGLSLGSVVIQLAAEGRLMGDGRFSASRREPWRFTNIASWSSCG